MYAFKLLAFENTGMSVYTFCRGFRLVVPYLYTIKRGAKKEWFGQKIEEVRSPNYN